MTEPLYLEDSYARTCTATVTEVTADGHVVLDRTILYPTGGGQPHDLGSLTDGNTTWNVTAVNKRGADVLHAVNAADNLPHAGSVVEVHLDWERRYRLMRTHTAMHVLCGVIFREFGALVTGGNMALDKARMDFELEDLDAGRVAHIGDLANAAISRGLPVSWRSIPRDVAFQIPDLIRTRINLLPDFITEVRVVEIDGLDTQADGGTHVRNTSEVGGITIIGTRSKGRINKRLEIALNDNS
jgi:misacylated tRNA(Ala) deacylase